jgi:hypothetical protein
MNFQAVKRLLSSANKWVYKLQNQKYRSHKTLLAFSVPGWFSREECQRLFEITLVTKGPILEIGHFLGRSTACITEALKVSEERRTFTSYDLGLISEKEFNDFFGNVHKKNVRIPKLAKNIYAQGKTSTELAKKNLANLGLDEYVELISGNFIDIDNGTYDFIFCDAIHEPNEIRLNLPQIMKRSGKNCIWAFHDMSDINIDRVLEQSNSLFIEKVDRLGIFLYLGE